MRLSQPRVVQMIVLTFAIALVGSDANDVAAQDLPAFDPAAFTVELEPIAAGFDGPVYVTGPDDGSDRLFVVEREGRIRIVANGEVRAEPFLDIAQIVQADSSEQGLLSVAFPPGFRDSGMFFVYYTARGDDGGGDNTIAHYRVSAGDPNVADPASGEVILAVEDSRRNHNGGLLLFGPDGYLYVGLGDGGGGGDPAGNGQNPMTLLGSILRLDVSDTHERPYGIPADNPHADGEAGAPEVWIWGLRNPWRFSFDRATGDLYIGDVGQGALEEIDWLPVGEQGGANLGWNVMEGTSCFAAEMCNSDGFTLPIAEYGRDFGCSVVGGYVYRGERAPALDGVYLFGDYCTGLIWGLGRDASGPWAMSQPVETGISISSFGEDAAGEIYVVDLGGELFRIGDGGLGQAAG